MILCVTPNPAIDHTLIIPKLHPGEVHRSTEAIVAAGGKGLNVARALTTLGVPSICAGFLGGPSGRRLAELAEEEGLRGHWTWIEGETRTCVILVDDESATVINEAGPKVTAMDWDHLQDDVMLNPAEVVCLSGSLPPGSPLDAYVRLIKALRSSGRAVWVDISGPALTQTLGLGLHIKINGAEAGALMGMEVTSAEAAQAAAVRLRERGAVSVVITLGSDGAVMVTADGTWFVPAPSIKAVSAVGSGDCFLAGLVAAQISKRPAAEALHWAVAAGAANARSVGGGRFTRREFEALLQSLP